MAVVSAQPLIQDNLTPESQWQLYLAGLQSDALPWHDWLPAQARLVVLAPHPDDEILASGVLMCMHAERGGELLLIAVTDGEASHAQSLSWDKTALAAVRRNESARGMLQLGLQATPVVRLGLPDGAVNRHVQPLSTALKALLEPTDVLLSPWQQDGHPDHEACGQAAALACAATACRQVQVPIWMWHWATPGDDRVPWQQLCAVPTPLPAWRRKQAALAAHVSQLEPRCNAQGQAQEPVLDAAIVARAARKAEYFFV